MNDRMDGEAVPRTMCRRRRRRLVTVASFVLVVVALAFAFAKGERMDLAFGFLLVTFLLYVVALHPVMDLTQKRVSKLDERELGIHGRAYFRAYRALGIIFGLTLAYMTLAATPHEVQMHYGTDFALPTSSQFSFLSLLYAYLLISLPAAMVAWTEPDVPNMDDED